LQLRKHQGLDPSAPREVHNLLLVYTHCSHIDITTTLTTTHSANCRRAGGSIGSIVYMFEEADVQISDPDGKLKSYKDNDTNSGKPVTRQFCGNCGW
jgi:hypothetical protein